MFDLTAQTKLAGASADMLRAYTLAAAHTANLSAFRTLALWTAWSRACLLTPAVAGMIAAESGPAAATRADAAFASYRSSSGHAVAQVIVG